MAVVWIWAAKKDERAGAEPEEIIPVEHLVLPEEKKTEKKRIALTFKEFELLRLFLSHPGIAFTRDQLFVEIWGMEYCGETRTVDMHIRTLRQKLGTYGAMIQTVRNVGYRWEAAQ